MINFLILLLVLLGAAMYFMSPEERKRFFRVASQALRTAKGAVLLEDVQSDPFFDALRARTPRVLVTPSLVVLSVTISILMAFNTAGGVPGEWWRLVATPFVHSGVLDLFVSAAALLQIGLILERLIGPLAFTTVYVAAGVAAGIVNVNPSAGSVSVGASGSVLAMYGLLLVTSIWSAIRRSSLTLPLEVAKRLAPVAAVFVAYNVMRIGPGSAAQFAALVCGLVSGIVVAREVIERTPPIRRISAAMATVVMLVTATAYVDAMLHRPPDQVTAVGPEIQRVIAVEKHTAGLYDHAVDRFRKGRTTTAALVEVIEQTIVPELHAAAARLKALQAVPPAHRPLVATAEEFLKLRDESWRLRAAALHQSDALGLRRADSKEQASLQAFHRLTPWKVGIGN